MRPLLISGFGTCLYTRKGLVVDDRSRHLSVEYPAHQLPFDWIIVDNYTGYASWSALRFLMAHSIPIVHMAWNGNLLGVTSPPGPISGKVKLGQYRTHLTYPLRLHYAKSILRAKLRLSETHLRELSKLYSIDPKPFEQEAGKYPEAKWSDINRLLEYEAKCANVYWREYRDAVRFVWPDSGFISRGNTSYSWTRNAADPLNALLNYGYAILEARCRVALVRAGFDPTIGYLHSIAPSKHPLVYDFQELGRALVDSAVLEMVRAEPLVRRKGAFLRTTDWGLRLAPETAQKLVQRLSWAFSRRVPGKRPMTWETALLREAQRFAEEVSVERRTPRAFDFELPLPGVQPPTLGDGGLTAKIADLTVPEARKLGIPKTTLWYQQKRLKAGAPVRVYRKVANRLDRSATEHRSTRISPPAMAPPGRKLHNPALGQAADCLGVRSGASRRSRRS